MDVVSVSCMYVCMYVSMYVVMMARASSRASRASRASDLQKVGGAWWGVLLHSSVSATLGSKLASSVY